MFSQGLCTVNLSSYITLERESFLYWTTILYFLFLNRIPTFLDPHPQIGGIV